MTRFLLAVRTAVYMTGFVILWGWLALTIRPLDARLGGPLPPWLGPPGLVLAALGAALAVACGALFVREGGGTPAPFDAPRRFVAVGPYRWVRNPMYLGALGVLAGVGLWLRSPAILLLALVAGVLAHLFVLAYEEPVLQRRFGASYEAYRQDVSRWVPRHPSRTRQPG